MDRDDVLPPFALPDQDGRRRSVADLAGPRGLILYVYPKDDTPGCTTEALDFQQRLADFGELGYRVAGVSKDDAGSHCHFRDQHGLAFPLLTDADGSYLEAIGAFGEKKLYGRITRGIIRSTFVCDPAGRLRQVFRNVRAKGHAERVLRALGQDAAP